MRVVIGSLVLATLQPHSPSGSAAQGSAGSTITGVVSDAGGGVLPGATVVVTSNATGTKFEAVTNARGVHGAGAVGRRVHGDGVAARIQDEGDQRRARAVGVPTTVSRARGRRALGNDHRQRRSAELINTMTPAVTATLNVEQIALIPTPTRNALNAVTFLVGVNTPGGMRGSTINGLPESYINLTLDGISNNDTFNKNGDGFFSPVRPRQDAVEAVTVTTAAGGAEVGGHGGVTINFVTRSGTNRFTGSAYEYFRDKSLNSNYWFNERNGQPKSDVRLNQFGARQGGPIVRNKAFFFVHYEEVKNPNDASRTRTALHPRALDGWFRYNVTVGGQQIVREVNVLDLARANGQIATTDPMVMRTLQAINASPQLDRQHDAVQRSAADELFLPESRRPGRTTAGGAHRLQPQRQASADRHLQPLLREARAGPHQRRRQAIPRLAELPAGEDDAADALGRAALDAVQQPGQRAARRHHARRAVVLSAGKS